MEIIKTITDPVTPLFGLKYVSIVVISNFVIHSLLTNVEKKANLNVHVIRFPQVVVSIVFIVGPGHLL